MERYKHLNKWLKDKFGERVLKICVDGGFSCPNRDGKCGVGGCIFCSEKGSGEHNNKIDISAQVKNHLESYRGKRANKFIVYFQNFTNTYDTIKNLKRKYDSALINEKIVGLSIGTRPDCINEDIAKLLHSYQNKYYVMVELGLQTSNENTARIINRCYPNSTFTKAVKILNKYNIPIITHIMIGLPNENKNDILSTVEFINSHKTDGIKIHSTYIVANTKLNNMYQKNKYTPLTLDEYISQCCLVLTHINPEIVIHRISGDAPKNLLIAPLWNLHKKWSINGIDKYMEENNLHQGQFYIENKK